MYHKLSVHLQKEKLSHRQLGHYMTVELIIDFGTYQPSKVKPS